MRKRITYANVVATLALVFAMSGGALAAKHYLINSTKQINPKVLKTLKGKAGATGNTGATGKEGAPGKEGKEGKQGIPGPVNLAKLEKVEGPAEKPIFVFFFDAATSHAECPAGSHVVSGGFETTENQVIASLVSEAIVTEGKLTGWSVAGIFKELKGTLKAIAYCAKEGSAVEASAPKAQRRTSHAALVAEAIKLHH
jgi:hypothetical protein